MQLSDRLHVNEAGYNSDRYHCRLCCRVLFCHALYQNQHQTQKLGNGVSNAGFTPFEKHA